MIESEHAQLPAELRRESIRTMLHERGYIRVSDITERFGISGVTARADLDSLVDDGIARRVHGGAVSSARNGEAPFEEALETSAPAKSAIGREAAALVRSGQSILLDVGTTALAVARALKARSELRDVVIITNGLNIALELESEIPRFTVIVTGGVLRPLQHSLVNPLAQSIFSQLHADIAFVGCNGVDIDGGVTNINLPEAEIKALMVNAADRVVAIADAAKLGRVQLGRFAGIDQLDVLVTDAGADPLAVDAIAGAGVEVLVAP